MGYLGHQMYATDQTETFIQVAHTAGECFSNGLLTMKPSNFCCLASPMGQTGS